MSGRTLTKADIIDYVYDKTDKKRSEIKVLVDSLLDIMKETGINPTLIRAGEANMFLSKVFRETLSAITGTEIHLYNTDGSAGAARGAGIGCGYYKSEKEAFRGLVATGITEPDMRMSQILQESYLKWESMVKSL